MSDLTLEDIARKAGVSRSTVSRVVNQSPNVSGDVRKRVLEVIQSTDYHPNAAARTLASQRSWTIGLVLPHSVSSLFTDPYYPHLIKGIAQACNQHNYTLALFLVDTKEDEEAMFPRLLHKGLLDGVIVQSGHHGDQAIVHRLVNAKMPLVVAGRPFNEEDVTYIDVDNVAASYEAVNHLIHLGYKRIATIAGAINSTVSVDRKKGYLKALLDQGMDVDESLIVEGDFSEKSGYTAMQNLLPVKPDAVFAASDTMAIGAMHAIQDAGLRVPEDIAVVGFDDLPIASFSDVQLTTVHQPVVTFGIRSVELLLELIEHGTSPARRVIVETELIVRRTCGAYQRK